MITVVWKVPVNCFTIQFFFTPQQGGYAHTVTCNILGIDADHIQNGWKKVIADLTNRLPWESLRSRSGGRSFIADGSEGSPSADGNRYAWAVFDGRERMVGLVSYDLETDTILGTMDIPPRAHIDNLSMSPSGKYVVVSGAEVTVYNADFSNPRVLVPSSEHSDIAIGTDGEAYYLHVTI